LGLLSEQCFEHLSERSRDWKITQFVPVHPNPVRCAGADSPQERLELDLVMGDLVPNPRKAFIGDERLIDLWETVEPCPPILGAVLNKGNLGAVQFDHDPLNHLQILTANVLDG